MRVHEPPPLFNDTTGIDLLERARDRERDGKSTVVRLDMNPRIWVCLRALVGKCTKRTVVASITIQVLKCVHPLVALLNRLEIPQGGESVAQKSTDMTGIRYQMHILRSDCFRGIHHLPQMVRFPFHGDVGSLS